ncbi:oxygenase MpaB family protein [Arthrobacter sp. TMS1-12-1]
MAGVARHSSYRSDPWARLAGTARWLTVSTFGSAELAGREAARVRGMHGRVRGTTDDGRAYSFSSLSSRGPQTWTRGLTVSQWA